MYKDNWQQFLETLDQHIYETTQRTAKNYLLHERMPEQAVLEKLQAECLELTTSKYGTPNLSVLYSAFIKMCEAAKLTFYAYDDLVTIKSKDGFVTLLDTRVKHSLTKQHFANKLGPYVKQGGLNFRGRSAIDNTTLSNILTKTEYQRLITYRRLSNLILDFVNRRREKLGEPKLENFGQIPQAGREAIWNLICKKLPLKHQSVFTEFAEFCRTKPGEYKNSRWEHFITIWAGIRSNELKLVPRSQMEKFNFRRHFSIPWQRRFPLQTIDSADKLITIRKSGVKEISRIRPNEGTYQPEHGLGMTYYGTVEPRSDFLWQLGLTYDPKSALVNNMVCDIEKIAREAEMLGPEINVGQNSWTGSSIPQTQHTQQAHGTIDQFPLYQENNEPVLIDNLQGTIDIIQVGSKPDAFFIKAVTDSVTHDSYLEFFINLRLNLLQEFGSDKVDFHFHIIPNNNNQFVTIMAPFAKLIKRLDQNLGITVFVNPDTGLNNEELNVPEHLHLANAAGRWGVDFVKDKDLRDKYINDGRGSLGELYNFTAKLGARAVTEEFIRLRYATPENCQKTSITNMI